MKNILVYGFVNKNNHGDNLFEVAFKQMFPNDNIVFTDHLNKLKISKYENIFIGGGSFLNDNPAIDSDTIELLKRKNIFYVGVGVETNIHTIHQELIKVAKYIFIRSKIGKEKIEALNNNILIIPDIVFALNIKTNKIKKPKSILILPNIHAVPSNQDAHWKHNSWNNFKFEFSQCLDMFIEEKYNISFFPMSTNISLNDNFAIYEIIASMNHRGDYFNKNSNLEDAISESSIVITSRFHGIILSEILKTNYISIWHHDKLKKTEERIGSFISFYGFNKADFIEKFSIEKENKSIISIEHNIFKDVVNIITNLME